MVPRDAPPLVVYLAYRPYGPEPVERFTQSYWKHDAGLEHRLAVVEKGPGEPLGYSLTAPDDGLDLQTYLWVARREKASRYLFLNTNSEILCDGWLEKLDSHLTEGVGIVGATGSYGRSNRNLNRHNPHVRTNAFLMERSFMLSLDWQEPIKTKEQAFEVEHGRNSITCQIQERGLRALVVGRDGQAYDIDGWRGSNTFWSGDQENLLIADNATRKYSDNPNGRHRRILARFAWH